MTVLDANNELFEWFRENNSFELKRDIKKIVPISEDEEETEITFKLALEELESNGLCSSKENEDKRYYILSKPFEAYTQNIEVSSWTAKFITSEINEFCELIQDNTDLCVASSIVEKDVRNLVHLSQYYKSKLIEKEQIIQNLEGSNFPPFDNGDDNLSDDNKKKK